MKMLSGSESKLYWILWTNVRSLPFDLESVVMLSGHGYEYVKKLVASLVSKGWAEKIRRGTWTVRPPEEVEEKMIERFKNLEFKPELAFNRSIYSLKKKGINFVIGRPPARDYWGLMLFEPRSTRIQIHVTPREHQKFPYQHSNVLEVNVTSESEVFERAVDYFGYSILGLEDLVLDYLSNPGTTREMSGLPIIICKNVREFDFEYFNEKAREMKIRQRSGYMLDLASHIVSTPKLRDAIKELGNHFEERDSLECQDLPFIKDIPVDHETKALRDKWKIDAVVTLKDSKRMAEDYGAT